MTKAGRWLPVSSSHQDEANQEPDVDRWIAQRGYEVAETYRVHGQSADHGEHEPELRRALADIKAGKIEVLVVWKSDRLERRGAYALMGLIREAMLVGGRLEFVTEPALNNASDPIAGPMLQAFYGAMGQHDSQTKSDRTAIKQAALRAAGSYAMGQVPYGYDIVTLPDGRKTLWPNVAAPVVARIFKEVAAGSTFSEVARGLTADGIPTYTGGAVWSEGSLKHIIRRRAYRGHLQYRGVTYMEVEPLTTAADWLAANQGVKARARGGGLDVTRTGRPLKALLRPVCGRCGAPLYRYKLRYRCAGVGPSGTGAQAKGCSNTISLAQLDAEVWQEFADDGEPKIRTEIIRGTDYGEEIAAVQLAIKDLDLLADNYDERHAVLVTELRGLTKAKPKPDEVITYRDEHETEGDAFKAMTPEEQRAFIRLWTLTVYPKDSDDPNALAVSLIGRRWRLTWKP